MAKKYSKKTGSNDNGVGLGFEGKLWVFADKLRGSIDATEYKHVVLKLTAGLPEQFAESNQLQEQIKEHLLPVNERVQHG